MFIANVPIQEFPEGCLAGARTPRELAEKAKRYPKEAGALFASGAVAADALIKSPADGYTILLAASPHVINPLLQATPYDAIKDFAGVTQIGFTTQALAAAPALGIKSVKELIAQSKASNGKFNIGSINIGTTQYLSAELLKSMAALDATSVPFNNTAGVLTALRGNSIQVAMEFLPPVLGQIRANTLRALAVTSLTRSPMLPNVPTLHESGLAGYEVNSWNGIAVAAKTPKAIVERLNTEIRKVVNSATIRDTWAREGAAPMNMSTDEFGQYLREDIVKWANVVKIAGVKDQRFMDTQRSGRCTSGSSPAGFSRMPRRVSSPPMSSRAKRSTRPTKPGM